METSRIARGPNRVPTRSLDAVSIGAPRMATSAPSSLSQSVHAGWLANVARPTKGKSIRSSVLRLVLSVLVFIAMSFLATAETLRQRPDWLIVQQISSVMPSRSYARRTEGRAVTLSRSFATLGRERGGLVIGRAQRQSITR